MSDEHVVTSPVIIGESSCELCYLVMAHWDVATNDKGFIKELKITKLKTTWLCYFVNWDFPHEMKLKQCVMKLFIVLLIFDFLIKVFIRLIADEIIKSLGFSIYASTHMGTNIFHQTFSEKIQRTGLYIKNNSTI